MYLEIVNLKSKFQLLEVRQFLKRFDLNYEDNIDYTIVLRENEKIIATASKSLNIIKCFAVDENFQGLGITNTLVTNILNEIMKNGIFHAFLYTKPKNINVFENVGFKLVAETDKVSLLEIGNKDIDKEITKIKEEYNIDLNAQKAIIVMNANPMTLGHEYLIKKTCLENEEVLVFVVEEDKSIFPFKDRIEIVKNACKNLKNVKIIPGTEYIISSVTFPNYFLKKEDDFLAEYIKLDVSITATQFCKKLNISKRYVGTEPNCVVTKKYNEIMKEILDENDIKLIEVPRIESNEDIVSASLVRKYIKEGNEEKLNNLIPKATKDFLKTNEGLKIIEKIKNI